MTDTTYYPPVIRAPTEWELEHWGEASKQPQPEAGDPARLLILGLTSLFIDDADAARVYIHDLVASNSEPAEVRQLAGTTLEVLERFERDPISAAKYLTAGQRRQLASNPRKYSATLFGTAVHGAVKEAVERHPSINVYATRTSAPADYLHDPLGSRLITGLVGIDIAFESRRSLEVHALREDLNWLIGYRPEAGVLTRFVRAVGVQPGSMAPDSIPGLGRPPAPPRPTRPAPPARR